LASRRCRRCAASQAAPSVAAVSQTPPALRAMQASSEKQRVEHGWYDELNVDIDLEVGGVAWLLLATDPWNILLNTAGILQHTDLRDIGELKEAICVRPATLLVYGHRSMGYCLRFTVYGLRTNRYSLRSTVYFQRCTVYCLHSVNSRH
jgi:hypothetical protein